MNRRRRKTVELIGALIALGMLPAARAADWNKAAFEMKTLPEALKALGVQSPASSQAILIRAPEIAENGAVVPIAVESRLPRTESITVLIEKNPQPLAASFMIPAGTEAFVSTRFKMAETSDVYVLVKAEGKQFMGKKNIKVTIGGCGA